MHRLTRTMLAVGLMMAVFGCGRIKEEPVPVSKHDPMGQVKSTLQNYVNGQPLASEVTSFDYMVESVRKESPEKADILKKGLDELKTVKGNPSAKAKALMTKLGLDK